MSTILGRGFLCSVSPSSYLRSIQVNNVTGFANLEVDRALAKLFSYAHEQILCFPHAVGGDKHFQTKACLFIHSTVIRDPGALERTLQGIAAKSVTDEGQDGAPLAPADFRSVIAMRRDAGN